MLYYAPTTIDIGSTQTDRITSIEALRPSQEISPPKKATDVQLGKKSRNKKFGVSGRLHVSRQEVKVMQQAARKKEPGEWSMSSVHFVHCDMMKYLITLRENLTGSRNEESGEQRLEGRDLSALQSLCSQMNIWRKVYARVGSLSRDANYYLFGAFHQTCSRTWVKKSFANISACQFN